MTPPLRVAAPAKLNLGLRVVGRRADGYHELESVFVPLDLEDTLTLRATPARAAGVTLRATDGPGVPAGRDNLAVRAAEAFLDAAGLPLAVEIGLAKRIPVGAGLGGGSSDAGAVLRALASRHPEAVPPERLADLALGLGADVPFFLDPRPAWVTGVGERVTPLRDVPPLAFLLVSPGVALSTARVFRTLDALGPPPSRPSEGPPALAAAVAEGALEPLLHNDLEAPALRLLPELRRLREALRELDARATGMSGSGPTLFSVFATRDQAEAARRRATFAAPVWSRVAVARESG